MKKHLQKIFQYLKDRFKFNSLIITMDLCKAQINAVIKMFQNANIILCFFHYMQRLIKHLKKLKSNNSIIKKDAKDLLSDLKIIVF